MKIAFYEPLCKGIEHLKFLSLTIRMIQKNFPNSQFYLFAESELAKNLQKSLSFDCVVSITNFQETGSRINNLINGNKIELSNIKLICSYKIDKVICTSVSYYTLKNLRNFKNKTDIYVFYHGILESLGTKYKPYNMLFWFRKELEHLNRNIKNIVLGECIKENLLKEIPNLRNNVFSVDLIYPDTDSQPKSMNDKINFAGVGFGKKEKGSDLIFELAGKFSDVADFTHIGKMDKELIPNDTKVNILGKDHPLNSDDFETALRNCDYGLLFYDNTKYRFTASGAIFDILTQHKPIICLKNTYFNYVFDKMGDIGYLCDNKEEMFSVISTIIDNHDDNLYRQKQQNIIDNIYKFSETEYEKQLNAIFKK